MKIILNSKPKTELKNLRTPNLVRAALSEKKAYNEREAIQRLTQFPFCKNKAEGKALLNHAEYLGVIITKKSNGGGRGKRLVVF